MHTAAEYSIAGRRLIRTGKWALAIKTEWWNATNTQAIVWTKKHFFPLNEFKAKINKAISYWLCSSDLPSCTVHCVFMYFVRLVEVSCQTQLYVPLPYSVRLQNSKTSHTHTITCARARAQNVKYYNERNKMNTFGPKCRPYKIKTVVVSISIFNSKRGEKSSPEPMDIMSSGHGKYYSEHASELEYNYRI